MGAACHRRRLNNVISWCAGQHIKALHAFLVEDLKHIPEPNRGILLAVSTVGLLRHR